jgi:hypothetical protein
MFLNSGIGTGTVQKTHSVRLDVIGKSIYLLKRTQSS